MEEKEEKEERVASRAMVRDLIAYLVGAASTSTQKVCEVVKALVKEGELTKQQGEKILKRVEDRISESTRGVSRRGRESADKVLGGIGLARRSDIERLEQRIAELERNLGTSPEPAENAPWPDESGATQWEEENPQ